MEQSKGTRFKLIQDYYYKITWGILALSIVLFVLGYIFVKAVDNAPEVFLYVATGALYYHFAHFAYGIISLIYYLAKLRGLGIKVMKTVTGILISPISLLILYVAILLLSFSQCVA